MKICTIIALLAVLVSDKLGSVSASSNADKTGSIDTNKEGNLRRQTWSTNTDCGTARCPRGYTCDTRSRRGNPMCIPCGHFGEPCCDDEDSKCAYHGLICDLSAMPTVGPLAGIGGVMSGSCQTCGSLDETCCEGNFCQEEGLVCDYYERTDAGAPTCSLCGAVGQRCCYDDGQLQCADGLDCDQTSVLNAPPTCVDNTNIEPPEGSRVFINEFHYDNPGSPDTGELIEIANPCGNNLNGYSVVLYNGSTGAQYGTTLMLPGGTDQFQVLSPTSIQNGAPDGMALVDPDGNVIEFLSYEGSFTANGGPADGMTSIDIGVFEPSNASELQSLQRTGTNNLPISSSNPPAPIWSGPAGNSFGLENAGQAISCV